MRSFRVAHIKKEISCHGLKNTFPRKKEKEINILALLKDKCECFGLNSTRKSGGKSQKNFQVWQQRSARQVFTMSEIFRLTKKNVLKVIKFLIRKYFCPSISQVCCYFVGINKCSSRFRIHGRKVFRISSSSRWFHIDFSSFFFLFFLFSFATSYDEMFSHGNYDWLMQMLTIFLVSCYVSFYSV